MVLLYLESILDRDNAQRVYGPVDIRSAINTQSAAFVTSERKCFFASSIRHESSQNSSLFYHQMNYIKVFSNNLQLINGTQ